LKRHFLTNHDDMIIELALILCRLAFSAVRLRKLLQRAEYRIDDSLIHVVDAVADGQAVGVVQLSLHSFHEHLEAGVNPTRLPGRGKDIRGSAGRRRRPLDASCPVSLQRQWSVFAHSVIASAYPQPNKDLYTTKASSIIRPRDNCRSNICAKNNDVFSSSASFASFSDTAMIPTIALRDISFV